MTKYAVLVKDGQDVEYFIVEASDETAARKAVTNFGENVLDVWDEDTIHGLVGSLIERPAFVIEE